MSVVLCIVVFRNEGNDPEQDRRQSQYIRFLFCGHRQGLQVANGGGNFTALLVGHRDQTSVGKITLLTPGPLAGEFAQKTT